jgi:hypothetical protein
MDESRSLKLKNNATREDWVLVVIEDDLRDDTHFHSA